MRESLLGNRLSRWLAGAALVLLASPGAHAQLSGTKTIPGTYATLAAAITDLNTQGVGAGGVTFNIAAGYTETFASPTAGAITATGTSANPIVFQKAGTGANPVITAGVGTTTTVDAIISLAGSDYVTIDGVDVAESSANTTTATQMEFGYALFRPSATDGCQFNTIRNCVVTLNKTNTGTIGIAGAAGTATSGTAVAATATSGANSSNRVYGNVVTNALTGVYFNASSSTSIANYDQNNEIGVTAGNTIGNFGGAASGYGAGGNYQNGLKITGNTINSTLNYTSSTASTPVAASTVTSTLRGIYTPNGTSSNLDITNNTITLASGATSSQLSAIENGMGGTAAGNTINITGNTLANSTYATATTASTYLLYTTSSPATLNITNNTLSANNIGGSASASATCYLLYNSGTPTTATISGNVLTNNTSAGTASLYLLQGGSATTLTLANNRLTGNSKTGGTTTSGTLYCLAAGTTAVTATGNIVSNNSVVTAGTSSASLYGYYNAGSPTAETLTGNTITNLNISGSTTSTSSTLYGMYSNPISSTTKSWTQNTIGGLSLTTGGTVYGISTLTGATVDISRNKVYDLSAGTSSGVAYGIYLSSGTTVTVANNLIGDLRAAAATGLQGVTGIYIGSPTTANLYYNTINLAATSTGATFGTTGIYFLTSASVDLRNNIVVNRSAAVGTGGYTVALRRSSGTSGTAPANLAATTNNNLYYAGTPSATNLIYGEGTTTATNAQQTLAAYKAFVANREASSVTELPTFASTTGTDATFLHFAAGTSTQAESGGTPVASITTDYDNDTRNPTTPDIGADEGNFSPAVAIAVTGTTYTQNNAPTAAGQTDQQVTGVVVTTTGQVNAPTLSSITFNVGSTSPSNISNAKLYSSGSSTFSLASATLLATTGSSASPSFTLTLTTPVALASGSNYFFLTYDIPPTATAGATVASTATAVVIGGTTYVPTLSGPAGPRTIVGPLVGTYYITGTVGSSPDPAKEFASLTAAFAAYNSRSLAGPVSFVLRDASYSTSETFPLVLNANSSASAANTLTIQPGAGVAPTISGNVATGAVLKINGADYVTIDGSNAGTTSQNLTITNTSTTGSGNAVVWIAAASATDGATNNAVRNTIITGSSSTGTPQVVVFLGGGGVGVTSPTTSTPAANSNNTLSNNLITRGYYGIFVYGVSATSLDQGNTITGNQIGQAAAGTGFGQEGLHAVYQQGLTLTGNDVQNVTNSTNTANLYGIFLADCKGAVVSRNAVHGISYTGTSTYKVWAIELTTSTFTTAANASAHRIDNNLVYGINSTTTSSTWNTIGLSANGGYGDQFYYNTVYLSGQLSAASGTAGSAAFANGNPSVTTASTNIDVRNNIFSIVGGTGGTSSTPLYANYTYGTNYTGSTLNYNDLYVAAGATGLPVIGHLTTSTSPTGDYATLAAWQAATSQEANSVSADPLFAQTTTVPYNLAPTNVALNNVATPISGVTTDYTGATRGTTPDMGAIEFTPVTIDLAPTALVAPATTSTCYGTAEAVSVSIRNAGVSTLNFATNPATLTVVVTLPGGTQTLTATVSTGSLASGASQTVVLPTTLNMSVVGTYSFAITATVSGDQNTSNDVLTPAPTRTVLAPVAGTLSPASSALCVSGTATLTLTGAANGSIQFQSSPDGTTFTDIAGATTSPYTTPVLTATTYYRAQVRCNTGVATSNVSTITVNNPLVASTNTPVAICVGSPATLTATASAGSSVRFFSAATGGTALTSTTAGSYTTPALTANTTYYAEAYTGGTSVAGLPDNSSTYGTFTQSSLTDYPLGFAVAQAGTLTSVDVYPTATGSLTIRLYSVSGGQPTGTATAVAGSDVTITVTAAQVGTRVTVPLNYALLAGDYKLSNYAGGLGRYSTYTGTYPLTSANGVLTVKGSYTLYSSTSYSNSTYNSFFNLTFTNECVGATRTAIQVNVTPAPLATFSYPATGSNCAGSTGTVAPTLAAGATAGTFTSTTGLTLNATTGVVNLATSTAGTYTVTNTAAASGGCPAATATATITVNPTPARPTLTPTYNGTQTTLTSSAATGNQFYFNGAPIAGATGQTYVVNGSATTYGAYTVVATNSFGCSSPASVATTVTTARSGIAGASLQVYPNPTPNGQVTLELSGFRSATQLVVVDALGRVVRSEQLPATTGVVTHALDLSGMASGVYLLRLTNADGVETRRLTRE